MTLTIKRVPDVCREGSSQEIEHPSQIFDGAAAVLVNRILGGSDTSWGEVNKDYWDAFNKSGRPLDVNSAAQILVDRFPQLKGRVTDLADRLCRLQPRVLSTDTVTIEFVTTVDLPVDRGTARRWGVDPLTAFLDLLEDAKGVIVENASLATKNGAPLVIATIQRGDEKWLDDLASLGFDFTGFRTSLQDGPQKHADALAGMKSSVINVPMLDVLVQGTQPNETLYNFGSVVQLTALDQVGNIIGVATVRPNNVDRTIFRRGGTVARMEIAQGADTTGPRVALDRIAIDTKLAVPQGKEAEMLALGAEVPASYVRMDAKIGTQTITEPGAALELELSGVTVASTSIPFSTCANIPANEEEIALRVHRNIAGDTMSQMMGKTAIVRAEGTDVLGRPKGDGQPVQGLVLDYALPERKKTTIAGNSLGDIPYDNVGLALADPRGGNLQEFLKQQGLEVVQRKVMGSTDQMFEVTVHPSLIQGGAPIAIDVGYRTPEGKWVWSSNEHGQSQSQPDVRTLGRKAETFKVLVPDSVFRQGEAATPANMAIRMFRPDKRTPLYLGQVTFDMKEIGRTPGQLTRPEEIWTQIQSAKHSYDTSMQSAVSTGLIIAEPISAKELDRRINNGGEWSFQLSGQTYTVKKDPTKQTQNAVLMLGEQVLNAGPDAVRYKSSDDLVPNEHFVVNMDAIIGAGYGLYVSTDSIRQAPFPLPAPNDESTPPRRFRLEQLTQLDANQSPVYPSTLWPGVEIQGQRINSQEDLQGLLGRLESDRQQALRELADQRRCADQKQR